MSRHESDDLEGLGYFLPEDSQFRLARLSDHIKFLARLAQPRTANEALEYTPEVGMGELTFCLEVLAEQLDLVLGEVSWPAQWTVTADAPERHATSAMGSEATDTNIERFAFGVTVDQIDMLGRLIQTISAHGDAVTASETAGRVDQTRPLLGQAIHDGVTAVRDLLVQVQAQRLGQGPRPRSDVGEQRRIYAVGLVSPVAAEEVGCNPTRELPSRRNRRALRRADSSVRRTLRPTYTANGCLPVPHHSSVVQCPLVDARYEFYQNFQNTKHKSEIPSIKRSHSAERDDSPTGFCWLADSFDSWREAATWPIGEYGDLPVSRTAGRTGCV